MNLLFFLTPKQDVCVLKKDYTIRQSIEKLRAFKHAAVPVIDCEGRYCGTIAEGDLLHVIIDHESPREWERIPISSILDKERNPAVNASTNVDDLLQSATEQNFVPVVDDYGVFIGIVTRKDIIRHFITQLANK
ncbi:MAG: CBS domain-containing protein [Eubacteriales bacterium]|nr:CBS domain-containing protein [Eubacteriales bacterium]